MRDQLQTRLAELKKEFTTGQARLQELEKQQVYLRETMLRISGAIQILEELLGREHAAEQHGIPLNETASQANPAKGMESTFQQSGLEGHNHQQSQDSETVTMLAGKE